MIIRQLKDQAEREGFDCIIATSFQNVRYLTGSSIYTQLLIPQRLAAVIVPISDSEPVLVACTIEQSLVAKEAYIKDLRGYQEFNESPITAIVEVIREKGLANSRIGIETEVIAANDLDEFTQQLPHSSFVAVDHIFNNLRMVKTRDEIEHLAKISLITDQAIRNAYESASVGTKEVDVLSKLVSFMIKQGAEMLPLLCLGAGPNEVHTHPFAGNYELAPNDLIGCDVGGRWAGYYSDLARVAVVGKATPHQEELYKKLWDIHENVIAKIKPGIKASELYWCCKEDFERKGIELSLSHVGHSLGLTLHERPMLCPTDHTELLEGMVLAIEPATVDATGKYHTEDLIEITSNGCKVLSRSADWSEMLIIN